MPELHKKRDAGIKGYDPKNKKPPLEMIPCLYCWFTHHDKSVMTKHVNQEHWDKLNA